jgi:hypothetical protein
MGPTDDSNVFNEMLGQPQRVDCFGEKVMEQGAASVGRFNMEVNLDGPGSGFASADVAGLSDGSAVGAATVVDREMARPALDLNVACALDADAPTPFQLQRNIAGEEQRVILGEADGRLNKDQRDLTTSRGMARGISRLAVPLKKALLGNPLPVRHKPSSKKVSCSEPGLALKTDRKKGHGAMLGRAAQPVEEQANVLLLKAAGVIGEEGRISGKAEEAFGEKFVAPMQPELLAGMREVLGIPVGEATGGLEALMIEVED